LEAAELRGKKPLPGGRPVFQPENTARLRIRVRDVLAFFDTRPEGSATHVSSLVAILGEDLGAALFCEYLSRSGLGTARVLAKSPTPGTKSGKRLDRWFLVTWPDGPETLLQAEIKNWSAQAIGGRVHALDASEAEAIAFRKNRWENQWDSEAGCFVDDKVGKVLGTMQYPSGVPLGIKVEPLAIYWFAIHPEGSSETFFEHPAPPNTGFERILFFSMSSFLRSVEEETIELDMPNAIARISWLGRLVETV
jgi:hypothetical protein